MMLIFGLVSSLEVGVVSAGPPSVFNILDFGAAGDGVADDTEAFSKAWAATCKASTGPPSMVVPKGKTFLVTPTIFQGPCKFHKVYIQIEGTVVAPNNPNKWSGIDASLWLQFDSISGLDVRGGGEINGQGQSWWKQSCRYNSKPGCTWTAPTAIKFNNCHELRVSNLRIVDSAQTHVLLIASQTAHLFNLKFVSPGDSPNTDGVHIQNSQHVLIEDCTMQTGDDCISIGDHVSDIQVKRIACGPGHGISIGSLGRGGTEVSVEDIHISYSNFFGTTNGARIKTWQGGRGFARGISFEHCNFTDVENPIIIDQYYCDIRGKCKSEKNAVQISDVTYADLQGTSKYPFAITLNCSESVPCTSMKFNSVNLLSSRGNVDTKAFCINAHGEATGYIHPAIPCLG